MRIMFRFRWPSFLACAFVVIVGLLLGQWQTHRARTKETIEATLVARAAASPISLNNELKLSDDAEYRRVVARGEFVRDWPIYLDNRPHNGIAGFYVLMPFRLEASKVHILVARGWVPRDPIERAKLPRFSTPQGVIALEGVLIRNPGHILQLGAAAPIKPDAILQNIDAQSFAVTSGLATMPMMLEQTSNTSDDLVRDWPRPSTGIERHRGYAFQWYALAATAFIFFVVTGFRRGTKPTETR